jgi:SAM-dependent methyltransferase
MRVLYGRYYAMRYAAVAMAVLRDASVLELCCGPGLLYLRGLRDRASSYIGLDANAGFVAGLRAQGVDARVADVETAELPRADIVVMQASLYHFLPEDRALAMIERMRTAARSHVIISEPVQNLASSRIPLVARLAARGTATAGGEQAQRFDEASLQALMARLGPGVLLSSKRFGRDQVCLLRGTA